MVVTSSPAGKANTGRTLGAVSEVELGPLLMVTVNVTGAPAFTDVAALVTVALKSAIRSVGVAELVVRLTRLLSTLRSAMPLTVEAPRPVIWAPAGIVNDTLLVTAAPLARLLIAGKVTRPEALL
jgi:hypothetical protein